MTVIDIFSRWLHVMAACLAIGGAFFLRFLLPAGTAALPAEEREGVLLRCRRVFKIVVHSSILFLILSGSYNAWKNFKWYSTNPPLMHGLFGFHLILALLIFGISLWLLAGRELKRNHRTWMKVNLVLMFLAVAAASSLKWARDHRMAEQAGTPVKVPR